ncbi:hypothetical protein [Pedobacter aquatilis]|uniref:hypothetical protein n=1 Tax=Pedobacter aquatilis TaxID=351343 RepID=UPI00292F6A3B|nr:hypothetical protein [Pedobacter aquatilis]
MKKIIFNSIILLISIHQAFAQNNDAQAKQLINQLSKPYQKGQVVEISKFAQKPDDEAFKFLLNHRKALDTLMGQRFASVKLMALLTSTFINPSLSTGNEPDWKTLQKTLRRYQTIGQETLLKAKYTYALDHQHWENYAQSYQEFFQAFGEGEGGLELNNAAWKVFKNTNNPKLLTYALGWSNLAQARTGGVTTLITGYMDTKANLLYKLGQKTQAIALQKKAITIAKQNNQRAADLESVLLKMQADEPTW